MLIKNLVIKSYFIESLMTIYLVKQNLYVNTIIIN